VFGRETTTDATYTDLTAAIAAAGAGAELDIVGTCTGNYTLAKNLTLEGIDTAGVKATLDGNSSARVVTVSAGVMASITNLRITGGNDSSGGGINNSGTLSISDSTIDHNTAGAIPFARGGGISTVGPLTVTDSEISHNTARFGGGIYSDGSGAVVSVTHSVVSANSGTIWGGGIYVFLSPFTVSDTSVTGNNAGPAGGGIAVNSGLLNLVDSTVTGNSAQFNGGGIFSTGNPVNASGANDVSNNTPDNCFPPNLIPGCT
jgi:hypothetical protein